MNSQQSPVLKPSDLVPGDELSITLAKGPESVGESLCATVLAAAPRAVRLQLNAGSGPPLRMWIPRRALTKLVRDGLGVRSTMARWWAPNDWQAILPACRHAETITA